MIPVIRRVETPGPADIGLMTLKLPFYPSIVTLALMGAFRAHYNHAMIHIVGNHCMESWAEGPRDIPLDQYEHVDWYHVEMPTEDRTKVLATAVDQKGVFYDYTVAPGLTVTGMFGVDPWWPYYMWFDPFLNCSAFVATSYLGADYDFRNPGQPTTLVVPDQLCMGQMPGKITLTPFRWRAKKS